MQHFVERGTKVALYPLLIVIIGGGILGSLPAGYFVGLAKHIPFHKQGSENVGATNVLRIAGFRYGVITFLCDAGKCLVGVVLIRSLVSEEWLVTAFIVTAVLSNWFPILLWFRGGGKGVALLMGGLVLVISWPYIALLVLWLLLLYVTNKMSVTNVVVMFVLPAVFWFGHYAGLDYSSADKLLGIFAPVAVSVSHRENLRRIWRGEERNVFSKRTSVLDRIFPLRLRLLSRG